MPDNHLSAGSSPRRFPADRRNVSDETNSPAAIPEIPTAQGPAKAKYRKPAFRHEKVFETMALACGKISNTQASCHSNKKNS